MQTTAFMIVNAKQKKIRFKQMKIKVKYENSEIINFLKG